MSVAWIVFITVIFFVLEILYFKVARSYNIVDKPNHRSSHSNVTIRGGGIIFFISAIIDFAFFESQNFYFISGVSILSIVSFADDISPLSSKLRFLAHFVASFCLLKQLDILEWNVYTIISIAFIIAVINAVNFMDGINGLTGGYSLLVLITLIYINRNVNSFVPEIHLILPTLALLVFLFFNFRVKAVCFAGDVGSVSIAFTILYFLLILIVKTSDVTFLFLLLVYGLDAGITILFRLIRGENIFKAHRSHFYQFLANEKKMSHLSVAALYVLVQGFANFVFVKFLHGSASKTVSFVLIFTSLFVMLRFYAEGYNKLTKKT